VERADGRLSVLCRIPLDDKRRVGEIDRLSRAPCGEPHFREWNQLDGWLRQIEGLRFVA
jgi:hypothetical protein